MKNNAPIHKNDIRTTFQFIHRKGGPLKFLTKNKTIIQTLSEYL